MATALLFVTFKWCCQTLFSLPVNPRIIVRTCLILSNSFWCFRHVCVVFLSVCSSDTCSRCWAVGYRALGKATRPSAGCFIAYKFTWSQLSSNRCSDIEEMHLNFIMVSISLVIQEENDKSNTALFCFLFQSISCDFCSLSLVF